MPKGFEELTEPQLDKASLLLDSKQRRELSMWWLPPDRQRATTPNFDIASTCTVGGIKGLLLVEAKAHGQELKKEAAGKRIRKNASKGSSASHDTIGAAIAQASTGLEPALSRPFSISRDTHYQMSNRFAWAWKLTELGIPVVLVYLGFSKAQEMRKPFASHEDWADLVRAHSAPLFSPEIWDRSWLCNGHSLVPLIRSVEQPLDGGT